MISRLDAVKALNGETYSGGKNRVSRALIVVQFAASLFLVASTHIMTEQFHYARTVDRGFDPENVLTIRTTGNDEMAETAVVRFLQQAIQVAGVEGILGAREKVGSRVSHQKLPEVGKTIHHYRVVGNFVRTIGIDLVSGKQLEADGPLQEMVVNQALVDHFEWEDMIGQTFPFRIGQIDQPIVVGVIEDFDFKSGAGNRGPLVLHRDASMRLGHIFVRVLPEAKAETYEKLKDIWQQVSSEVPHLFGELDWRTRPLGPAYDIISSVGGVVSVFGIVIFCLGLVGLATQTLARRRKEVGVRKVMGASIWSIFSLLSARFVRLTLIGCFIGGAGSYFVMEQTGRMGTHKIPLTADLFVFPMVGMLTLALASIGYHTLRTARTEPTEELRCE